jgi:hypothetical protein
MHRWLFVGLAIMAAVGGVGTALVSGQRPTHPTVGLKLIAMAEETSAGGFIIRVDPNGQQQTGVSIPNPEDLENIKTADELNAEHTRKLKAIVKQYGWPGKHLVGLDGAHAAFVLVQRADTAFQQEALRLMQALSPGQVDKHDLALLTDRVAVATHQPQTYGTQLLCKDGQLGVGEVIDPANLDKRRAEVDLPPLDADLRDAGFAIGTDCDGRVGPPRVVNQGD